MIRAEEIKRDYPFEFDAKAYKEEFATLISIMEGAEAEENRKEEKKKSVARIIDSLLHM